jgi:glycosyltransferase involved in cell wall biosynthesis
MAAGKPIIASRVGGMKELIHDGEDGLLARPEAKSFAEAILKICNDVDLRKRIERNAIKRAKMFLWSNIISDYLNLYNALVEK